MSIPDSSSLKFWEFVSELGFLAVIVGVIGESAELVVKWGRKRRLRKWLNKHIRRQLVFLVKTVDPRLLPVETAFFIVLVIGLAAEFLGSHMAMQIADRESARLNAEAGQARKDAGAAIERAANVESTNLVLRAKVAQLELKLQPRRITMEQVRAFVYLAENIEKIPIKIVITTSGPEESTFASDLREMFTYAGFKTNSSVNNTPVEIDLFHRVVGNFGVTNEPIDLLFVAGITNADEIWLASTGQMTNGVIRPRAFKAGPIETYFAVCCCLRQIGIRADWLIDKIWVKPDECQIVVMPK
jgi:hypothetical protein